MLSKLKITARLSLDVIIGCALILVFLSIVNYEVGKVISYKATVEQTTYMVSNTANKIDSSLSSIAAVVDFCAKSGDMSEESLKNMLPYIIRSDDAINGACFAYNTDVKLRNVYCCRDAKDHNKLAFAPPTYDYRGADWYTLPRDLEHPCWTDPYFDEGGTEVLMVTYTAPVFRETENGRKFLGILTADVTIEWIQKLIESYSGSKSSYNVLITNMGTVIYHPEKKYIMNETIFSAADGEDMPILRYYGKNMIAGVSGFGSYGVSSVNKKQSNIAYAPIVSTGWSLAYIVSSRDLFYNLEVLNRFIILAGFIGISILVFIVVRMVKKILAPIGDLETAAKEYAKGNLDYQMPAPENEDEISSLINEFNKMKEDIKTNIETIRKADREREKIESELSIASNIQQSMLPKKFDLFKSENIDIYAFVKPAKQVGGDLYNMYRQSDSRVAVVIGDVSGKGTSAALFMSMVITTTKVLWKEDMSPAEALAAVNAEIAKSNSTDMFVTLLFGIIDEKEGTFTYSLAGHPAPYILHNNNDVEMLERLKGKLAGVFEFGRYNEKTINLKAGDMIYMFTDGVDECMNIDNEQFGHERIAYSLKKNGAESAKSVCDKFYSDLKEFAGDAEQSDDITMLSIVWKGNDSQCH